MKILLAEDDQAISKGLIYLFEKEKYEVFLAHNTKEAKKRIEENDYDLAILDVFLPDGNGFDLFEDYLKDKKIPTLFLTAKDEENDIIKGLELGAEDYITKPFSSRELLVRIKKIMLRNKKNNRIKVKDISFDIDKMVVYKNEKPINLTSLELNLLFLLFTRINKVVTREQIIDKIWDLTGNDVNDNTVTVYLKRIREKLDTDIIITLKGIGYRIDSDEEQ